MNLITFLKKVKNIKHKIKNKVKEMASKKRLIVLIIFSMQNWQNLKQKRKNCKIYGNQLSVLFIVEVVVYLVGYMREKRKKEKTQQQHHYNNTMKTVRRIEREQNGL